MSAWFTPTQSPQHQCITGVSSVLWAGQTLPAAFYQWTTTSSTSWGVLNPKWCLQQQPAQIPASVTQDFRDWFSARAALCPAKVHESREKKSTTSQKTKQQPKQTKALWNCNLWISVRKWKEEACSKGSVYPLLVSQQWHWAILEHRHSFGDTKYRRAQHLWKGTEAKSPTQWVRHLLPMPCPATSQELQRPRPLQGREFKGQNAVYPCCYTFAANKCFSSPAPNAAKTLMQQYSVCVFGGSTGEFLRNHSRV